LEFELSFVLCFRVDKRATSFRLGKGLKTRFGLYPAEPQTNWGSNRFSQAFRDKPARCCATSSWNLSFLSEFFYCLRLLASIKRMMKRQTRITQKQPWTRITHDLLHFLSQLRLIAVDQTFATCRFFFLKRALVQSQKRILQKMGTFGTQLGLFSLMVMPFAVNVNHHIDSLFFSCNAWMLFAQSQQAPF